MTLLDTFKYISVQVDVALLGIFGYISIRVYISLLYAFGYFNPILYYEIYDKSGILDAPWHTRVDAGGESLAH